MQFITQTPRGLLPLELIFFSIKSFILQPVHLIGVVTGGVLLEEPPKQQQKDHFDGILALVCKFDATSVRNQCRMLNKAKTGQGQSSSIKFT